MHFRDFINRLAIVPDNVSLGEKLVTALGCFIGILIVTTISRFFVEGYGLPVLIASMGASSILVFAVPHSPFSQPWSVIGGHVISALVGISCLLLISNPLLASAIAVSLAAFSMYYLRCLHPPGGATALASVLGGQEIQDLGFQFAITPVGIDTVTLIAVALIFNNLVPKRSYPSNIQKKESSNVEQESEAPITRLGITPEDLESALKKMDTFIDVAPEDLLKIYMYAHQHAHKIPSPKFNLNVGHCYSNGEYHADWSIRQIVSIEKIANNPDLDRVTFKRITRKESHIKATCTRKQFTRWAKYEVCSMKHTDHN